MVVPFYRRFRADFDRMGSGFYFRVACGVFLVYFAWKYPDYSMFDTYKSTAKIGFIPLKLEEGQFIPCWTLFKREIQPPMRARKS